MYQWYIEFPITYRKRHKMKTNRLKSTSLWRTLLSFSLFILLISQQAEGHGLGVISLDLGSEYMKVALVKPGVPMETVLNKESQRKTPTAISLRNGERTFGDNALAASLKSPSASFLYVPNLIGRRFDSPEVEIYKKRFPFNVLEADPDRGTVLYRLNEDTVFTIEELLGMLLNNSRQFSEDYAGMPINNIVITVPPYYTQAERTAVLQAANLVGLNVLQLMDENVAAALQYGVFRRSSFNATPQYLMFYDMGATSTTATIAEYKTVQVKEGGLAEMVPQLSIKGVGFDRTLGGLEMDFRLRDHLLKEFQAQGRAKGDITKSPRSMAKLLKEAKRVKMVLSANTDHVAQIEGLFEELDFSVKVSRETLENLCSDLYKRVKNPVQDALEAADMTLVEIDSVILVGGGTRSPKVQEELLKAVKKSELGKSLNTDEAIALGAVYQGAALSKGFKVKKFQIKGANVYPIEVSFDRKLETMDDGQADTKNVKRMLFRRSNPIPQKKVMTFNKMTDDFAFRVSYTGLDQFTEFDRSCIGESLLLEVTVGGIAEAFSKNEGAVGKGVKAHFEVDHNGLLLLNEVEQVFEKEVEEMVEEEEKSTFTKISETISSFFSGSEAEKADEDKDKEDAPVEEESSETAKDQDDETTNQDSDQSQPSNTTQTDSDSSTESKHQDDDVRGDGVQESEGQGESVEEPVVKDEEEVTAAPQTESEEDRRTVDPETESKKEEVDPEMEDVEKNKGDEPNKEESTSDNDQNQKDEQDSEPSAPTQPEVPDAPEESLEEKPKKKLVKTVKTVTVKEALSSSIDVRHMTAPGKEALKVSKDKLKALQEKDDAKKAREKAQNSLESFIFETQDFMDGEEAKVISTEEQRTAIMEVLSAASEWLFDEGEVADTEVLSGKLTSLHKATQSFFYRLYQYREVPVTVQKLKETLNVSKTFVLRMDNLSLVLGEDDQVFTETERKVLVDMIIDTETWFNTTEEKQRATALSEEPVLTVEEINERMRKLDRELMYLLNKLKLYRPKPKPKPQSANETLNATSNASNDTTAEQSEDSAQSVPDDSFWNSEDNKDSNEEQDQTDAETLESENVSKDEEIDTSDSQVDNEEKPLGLPSNEQTAEEEEDVAKGDTSQAKYNEVNGNTEDSRIEL